VQNTHIHICAQGDTRLTWTRPHTMHSTETAMNSTTDARPQQRGLVGRGWRQKREPPTFSVS